MFDYINMCKYFPKKAAATIYLGTFGVALALTLHYSGAADAIIKTGVFDPVYDFIMKSNWSVKRDDIERTPHKSDLEDSLKANVIKNN